MKQNDIIQNLSDLGEICAGMDVKWTSDYEVACRRAAEIMRCEDIYTKSEIIDTLYDVKHQIQEIEKTVDSDAHGYWWREGIRDAVNKIQDRIEILKAVVDKKKEKDEV